MPFVITTKRPWLGWDAPRVVSRVAVATLGDAWRICDEVAVPQLPPEALWTVPGESGGTFGPLPDGTTIHIEPVTYYALWHAVPWDSGLRGGPYMETEGEQNIAAFNAFHAQEANR